MAKKKGLDIMHADVHEDEELHVSRTTPQGTQEAGVETGHEQRDIKVRAILRWFAGLTIGAIVTIIAMVVLVMVLTAQDRAQKIQASTELYGTDVPIRTPELLPNPQQKEFTLPWDHYRKFVESESKVMQKAGLEDADGRPALPVTAVSRVAAQPARRSPATNEVFEGSFVEKGRPGEWILDEERPSDASGGTRREMSVLTR